MLEPVDLRSVAIEEGSVPENKQEIILLYHHRQIG